MPLTISSALQTHLDGELTTLATLWKVERRDGVEIRLTDHDVAVEFGGETYQPGVGYDRSAVEDRADLSVDNTELTGLLSSGFITREAIRRGEFDGARVTLRVVNYADLSQGAVVRRTGFLGAVTQNNLGQFRAELRGLAEALQTNISRAYTAGCRVDLGSQECGVDLDSTDGWARDFVVDSAFDRRRFQITQDDARGADATWFRFGVVRFSSGENEGVAREVRVWDPDSSGLSGLVEALTFFPYDVQAGDAGVILPGCDKSLSTCAAKFANAVNFRGFPHVPGENYLADYPGAKG